MEFGRKALSKEYNVRLYMSATLFAGWCSFVLDDDSFAFVSVVCMFARDTGCSTKVAVAFNCLFLGHSCQNIKTVNVLESVRSRNQRAVCVRYEATRTHYLHKLT